IQRGIEFWSPSNEIRAALVWIVLGTGMACCTTPAIAQIYETRTIQSAYRHTQKAAVTSTSVHLNRPVQRDALGSGSAMLRQSIVRATSAARGAALISPH